MVRRAQKSSAPGRPGNVKKDWNSILVGSRQLPTGLRTEAELQSLLQEGRRISGLVVCISASEASVIQSLIEPGEFAARSGDHEFVIFSPTARGADAPRRLNRISDDLWNIQQRSLGYGVQHYYWGGLEVRDLTLPAALESAQERLQGARRQAGPATRPAGPAAFAAAAL